MRRIRTFVQKTHTRFDSYSTILSSSLRGFMALAVISCSFGQSCDIAPVVPGGNPDNSEQVLGSHPDYPQNVTDNSSGDSAVLPVAAITANANVTEGEEVVLDGSAS